MRRLCVVAIVALLPTAYGRAENGRPAGSSDSCVDVQIGADHSFDCLNRRLRREAQGAAPRLPSAPIDARSSDLKTGVVNIPAIRQQFGRNFGVSATPYRDPAMSAPPALRR